MTTTAVLWQSHDGTWNRGQYADAAQDMLAWASTGHLTPALASRAWTGPATGCPLALPYSQANAPECSGLDSLARTLNRRAPASRR